MEKDSKHSSSDFTSSSDTESTNEDCCNTLDSENLDALCAALLLDDARIRDDHRQPSSDKYEIGQRVCLCNATCAWNEYADLHIRYALNIRIVGVEDTEGKSLHTGSFSQAAVFIIRISDIETKHRWFARKSLRELIAFYNRIKFINMSESPVKKTFWGTFRTLRAYKLPRRLFLTHSFADIEKQRKVFDSFLRHTAALVSPAPLGPLRRQAILALQNFIYAEKHCGVFDRPRTCIQCNSKDRGEHNIKRDIARIFTKISGNGLMLSFAKFVCEIAKKTCANKRKCKKTMDPAEAKNLLQCVSKAMQKFRGRMESDPKLLQYIDKVTTSLSRNREEEFFDDVRHAIAAIVEQEVYLKLEDYIYEALHALICSQVEMSLKQKMCHLQNMPQGFFGVDSRLISSNDWENARREFRQVDDFALPADKARCLVRAAKAIVQSDHHSKASPYKKHDFTSATDDIITRRNCCADTAKSYIVYPNHVRMLAADDFLPIQLFVIVSTNTSKPLTTQVLLQIMCSDPHDVLGEIGYYLTNFEAAIRFVNDVRTV